VDRPPSQADATSAQPPKAVGSRHTTYSPCQSSKRYSGPRIARTAHYCVGTLRPSFVRFPIALSFRIPALPLLSSFFYLTLDTGRHRSASTCVAYLYITLSPGPGEGYRRTHATQPLLSLFPFAYHRLEPLVTPVMIPLVRFRPFENAASFPLFLPCAFAFPLGTRTRFGPDLSPNSLAAWTVHLRYNTFCAFEKRRVDN